MKRVPLSTTTLMTLLAVTLALAANLSFGTALVPARVPKTTRAIDISFNNFNTINDTSEPSTRETTQDNNHNHQEDAQQQQQQQPPPDAAFPLVPELFPQAMMYSEVGAYLLQALVNDDMLNYDLSNTLCVTSMCGEALNRPFETALAETFEHNYNFNYLYYSRKLPATPAKNARQQQSPQQGGSGLAGCPFGGVPSFRKMKLHIPQGGNCVLVYGPHVGVSLTGQVGTVGPTTNDKDGWMCCRSAIAAAEYVTGVYRGERHEAPLPMNPVDAGQYFVGNMLMPYAERLEQHASNADNNNQMMVELPYALFETQTEMLQRIIREGCSSQDDDDDEVEEGGGGFPGKLTVLGGIQINTPPGKQDYFVPLRFDLYNEQGEIEANLFAS